ncbi:PepSY domain-containing protein [Priestia flexa]|uniref:PepSY domain-containing protein n=1 Tax=Priestia flexa TaxID=86664 RepID=UPI001EF58CB7|nr:PepSY domain-containing protein [Priestia flexa]MCG7314196.1 PepSY domain-containing protein [Priestia flexa]
MKRTFIMVLSVLAVAIGIWYWVTALNNTNASSLSESDIQSLVKQKYEGQIERIKKIDNQFHVQLTNQNNTYEIMVDGVSGDIVDFSKVSKSTNQEKPPPQLTEEQAKKKALERVQGTVENVKESNEHYDITIKSDDGTHIVKVSRPDGSIENISNPPKNEQLTTLISKEGAKKIALEKVKGTISSVELEDDDDQLLYEVEIDQSPDEEATVLIDAYSGEIISIQFETDDD